MENIKTCSAIFLVRCRHVVSSEIIDRPLRKIKLDWNLVLTGSFFVFHYADDVRSVFAKKLPVKSHRKATVEVFHRAGTDRLLKNKWMVDNQWARHINDAVTLAGTSDAPPLAAPPPLWWYVNQLQQSTSFHPPWSSKAYQQCSSPCRSCWFSSPYMHWSYPLGSALPFTCNIQINGNDIYCAIRYDMVLKLHELDGKHNAEGIYHNKIMPPFGSSIHCYQFRKKGEQRYNAIWNQGDTW